MIYWAVGVIPIQRVQVSSWQKRGENNNQAVVHKLYPPEVAVDCNSELLSFYQVAAALESKAEATSIVLQVQSRQEHRSENRT